MEDFCEELKAAMRIADVMCCRKLLHEKGRWLTTLQGYEQVELLELAMNSNAVEHELTGALLEAGVPAHCV